MTEEQRRLFRQISIEKAEHDRTTEINYAIHNARIETARALLALGVNTVEQIAQATGLSLAEVQELESQFLSHSNLS